MMTYQIELTNDEAAKLKSRADQLGIRLEELLRSGVREMIELSDEHIKKLIHDSVHRHKEALKRLA